MKRTILLFAFLAVAMMSGKAEDGDTGTATIDGIEWTYKVLSESEKTCSLTKVGQETEGAVTTPQVVNGYSVTEIGWRAFSYSRKVTDVTVSEGVTLIDQEAFRESPLKSLRLPDGLKTIAPGAFYYCRSLSDISWGTTLDSIGYQAFDNCDNLQKLEFPNSLRVISYDAFRNCRNLESVHFGSGMKSIGARAFRRDGMLSEVIFSEGLETIGYNAFDDCNLKTLYIPASVKGIGGCAFESNSSLTSIVVSPDNQYYDSRNNCNAIICKSDMQLLAGCNSTVIPEDVRIIGVGAFKDCMGLTQVVLPSSVKEIYGNAFQNCKNLTHIVLPAGLRRIVGGKEFDGCDNLKTVTCYMKNPCSILSACFSETAFANATLQVRKGCKEKYAATNYWNKFGNIVEVEAPEFMEGDRLTARVGDIDVAYRIISEENKTCCVGDITEEEMNMGYFQYAVDETLTGELEIPAKLNGYKVIEVSIGAFATSSLSSIKLPETITKIEYGAFYGCSNLETVTLPKNIEFIEYMAFSGCEKLESITLPSGITSIEKEMFNGCSSLKKVILPEGVKEIGEKAFYQCAALTDFKLPTSLQSIGQQAFWGCSSLTSITFPASLKTIESSAFQGCISLKSIVLSENLRNLGQGAFVFCMNLESVYSPIMNPFEIDELSFTNYDDTSYLDYFSTATLYVPTGTKALYESTPAWNKFPKIEEYSVTKVDDSFISNGKPIRSAYYSLDGKPHQHPVKGINIVIMSNGTVHKMVY